MIHRIPRFVTATINNTDICWLSVFVLSEVKIVEFLFERLKFQVEGLFLSLEVFDYLIDTLSLALLLPCVKGAVCLM